MVETIEQSLVDELVEEGHLFRSIVQHILNHVLQHILLALDDIIEVCIRKLRLDHPELRCMTLRVRVLSTEGRSEGVDVAERLREGLAVELTGHREARLLVKEVLAEIHLSVLGLRNLVEWERRYLEHLAGTLRVGSGDDRGVHIYEATLLEELMDRKGHQGTDLKYGLKGVGSRTQMIDRTKVLERMTLLLQRIVRRGRTLEHDLVGLHFECLLRIRRRHELTLYDDGRADTVLRHLLEVRHGVMVNDLKRGEEGTVGNRQETELLRITVRADPAADRHFLIIVGFFILENLS